MENHPGAEKLTCRLFEDVIEMDQAQNDLLQDNSTDTQNVFLSCSVLKTCFFSLYAQSRTRKEGRAKVVWTVKVPRDC